MVPMPTTQTATISAEIATVLEPQPRVDAHFHDAALLRLKTRMGFTSAQGREGLVGSEGHE